MIYIHVHSVSTVQSLENKVLSYKVGALLIFSQSQGVDSYEHKHP